MLIDKTSLGETLDAINAALFDGRTLTAVERGQAARWIAGRQGLPGAYADRDVTGALEKADAGLMHARASNGL